MARAQVHACGDQQVREAQSSRAGDAPLHRGHRLVRPHSDPNVARSIMDRLRNEVRSTGEAFNPLLVRYVGFRLLHRLSVSDYRDRFFVKGATMFLLWTGSAQPRLIAQPSRLANN